MIGTLLDTVNNLHDEFLVIYEAARGQYSPRADQALLAVRKSQRTAGDAWAELNGLKRSQSRFSYKKIATGWPDRPARRARNKSEAAAIREEEWEARQRERDYDYDYFDHAEFYRWSDGCPAAIVAHLYPHKRVPNPAVFAASVGLEAHFAPVKAASWYWPGRTLLVCYTRPGETIQWLSENADPRWERT